MKTVRVVFGIFFVVGLGLLSVAGVAIVHTRQFLATAISAPGVVTEVIRRYDNSRNSSGYNYYPRVRFQTQDGKEIIFVGSVGSSPPAYHVNEAVTVLYDPNQPSNARLQSFVDLWLLPTILGGLGTIFCSLAVVAGLVKFLRSRKEAWLQQNGRRIHADFTGVELNTSLRVNGRSPYRLACQWQDPASNQMYVFRSRNLWFDPTQFVSGKTLDVLIDPENPRRYLVDTSFLPKAA